MRVEQTERATALVRELRAIDARALEIRDTVDRAAFGWVPPEGAWSVGQVFEHLCIVNDDYLRALRALTEKLPVSASVPAARLTWRPSFVGGFLARSMVSPRKLPAPRIWRPGPEPRPNVIEEFLARQREIVGLIERSTGHAWSRMRLASPVSPLIRMNVGDAFTIMVRHEERHFRQIDERLAAYAATRREQAVAAR